MSPTCSSFIFTDLPSPIWVKVVRETLIPKCLYTCWIRPEQSMPLARSLPPQAYGVPRNCLAYATTSYPETGTLSSDHLHQPVHAVGRSLVGPELGIRLRCILGHHGSILCLDSTSSRALLASGLRAQVAGGCGGDSRVGPLVRVQLRLERTKLSLCGVTPQKGVSRLLEQGASAESGRDVKVSARLGHSAGCLHERLTLLPVLGEDVPRSDLLTHGVVVARLCGVGRP